MNTTKALSAAALLCLCQNSMALEFMNSNWKGEGELGYVSTGGNTETESVVAKLGLINDREKWRHTLGLDALNNSDSGTQTAERYAASIKSDYKFNEFDYLFVMANYETDKFSGYDYRISEAFGYGRRVLNNDAMTLDLEIGPGLRQSKLNSGESENVGILRGAGKFAWKINDNAKFTQDLSTEIGEDATITTSVTALTSNIAGNLAMKLSFTAKNTSDVPLNVEKTDTRTGVTLVYGF